MSEKENTLATKYDPKEVEDKWYQYWESHDLFKSVPDEREPYCIVIPPPNVTGVLHMGHMLNNTIQDILIRRARMEGKNALWVPGTDHASIATEAKVVKRNIAVEQELDLLCVAPNANPPVCKILNYGKYRFEQQKKAKENKKKQHVVEVKEIQLTPQIGGHDLETKAKAARRFLEDGNKVKVGVRFRGRQMTHIEVGEEVMNRFIALLEDVCIIEKAPSMDGKWLNGIIAPRKDKK